MNTGKAPSIVSQPLATSAAGAAPVSRREFLNYLLAGSVGLLALEGCGAATWFALPHLAFGQNPGLFKIGPSAIPGPNVKPISIPEGQFWLSSTSFGLLALERTCTHRQDSYYVWVRSSNRFECPKCGSRFRADGTKIGFNGPALRGLDRYVVEVTTPHGIIRTSKQGDPVDVSDATIIIVNTQFKIPGPPPS